LIGKRDLSIPYFPFSSLPRGLPRSGLGCDPLRRELAITGLDWSLAPSPRSKERIARQNPFEPPPDFRLASPCPGLDRPVSSITAVTTGPFRPRASPVTWLRAFGFPSPTGLQPLSLPQLRTPRPVFLDGTCDPSPPPSHSTLPRSTLGGIYPFRPHTSVTVWFQVLLTPLPGHFSSFRHRTRSLSVLRRI